MVGCNPGPGLAFLTVLTKEIPLLTCPETTASKLRDVEQTDNPTKRGNAVAVSRAGGANEAREVPCAPLACPWP